MDQAEDVVVILAHDRRYKFHSGTLARNSTRLAEMLSERNAAKLNTRAKLTGVTRRWMIELKELPSLVYPAGRLELVVSLSVRILCCFFKFVMVTDHGIPKELTPTGEREDGGTGIILNENGRVPTKVFDFYESIFYAFYNKEIQFRASDLNSALHDCQQMIDIAGYLGCTNIVSKPIELALMKHGQELFNMIKKVPYLWVKTAIVIKSELIFRESMIHLAGNWGRLRKNEDAVRILKDEPDVRRLAAKYHADLVLKGKTLEKSIASLYPGDMLTPSIELPIKREEYCKDILVWMALSFFRHWFGQRLASDKGHVCEDAGYSLYRQLGSAGEAYMDKQVINQFHNNAPMTKKAMNVLENHLLEIKECVKGIVEKKGILKNKSQLDLSKNPVNYLTCTDFQGDDLPWLNDAPPVASVKKPGRRPGGNDIARENLEAMKRTREMSRDTETDEEAGMEGDHVSKRAKVDS